MRFLSTWVLEFSSTYRDQPRCTPGLSAPRPYIIKAAAMETMPLKK